MAKVVLVAALASACFLATGLTSNAARANRPVPDYDGRTPEPDRERIAREPLRIMLAPAYAAHEYLIRQPLGALVRALEGSAEASGPPRRSAFREVRPIFVVDVGFNARIGARGALREGDLEVPFLADGGVNTFTFGIAPSRVKDTNVIGAYGIVLHRPDAIFHGLGGDTTRDARVRVAIDRGDAGVRAIASPAEHVTFAAAVGVHALSIRTAPLVDSYVAGTERLEASVDTTIEHQPIEKTHARSIRSDGIRLTGYGEHASTFGPARGWIAWGGALFGSVDVTGESRILEAGATVRFVDPIEGGEPPWPEQVSLGGDLLRGHLEGRVRGRSAAAFSLQWRWPVWTFLEGFVLGEAGNVFGAHLSGFAPRDFRLSAVAGMRHVGTQGWTFELMSGVGTEPIREGANVSSVRFLFGAARAL